MIESDIETRAYYLWLERQDATKNWLAAEKVERRPPLLVLLGAGASLDLGVPSTWQLTTNITLGLSAPTGYPDQTIAGTYAQALLEALAQTYVTPNFEHIAHGLEALSALRRSLDPTTVPEFRIVEAALTAGLHPTFRSNVDRTWLIAARAELYRRLHQSVSTADLAIATRPEWSTIQNFFRQLENAFDLYVVTTNYDSVVEQALGWGAKEQGYEQVAGEEAFRFIGQQSPPRLIHLHGSLHFGFRQATTDPNRFAFEDDHEDLYWFASQKDAFNTLLGRSGLNSMAGRDTQAGPMITGLQKPDKLLPEPYMSSFRHFQTLCSRIPRVLIAGYGFGDQHVNAVVSRLAKWHGGRRKIVIIDYCDESAWQPAHAWGRERNSLLRNASKLAGQVDPLDVLDWPDPWVSSGSQPGCLEAYFRGMLGTVSAHGARLLDFLRS
jgi:hypothetical protein